MRKRCSRLLLVLCAFAVVLTVLTIDCSAQTVPTAIAAGSADALPKDLSPWGMFKSADIVVKCVMLGLAFASLVTWTVAVGKAWELRSATRTIRRDLDSLFAAPSIDEARQYLVEHEGAWALVDAAATETQQSADTVNAEGIKERVVSHLQRLEAGRGRAMMRGTGLLATIGATAPFVGLFGTVWGIMNSFIGISKLHTTNLAIVAPGIAEALLATAMGLVVAIPAVVIYNVFSRAIAAYRALHADAAAAVLRLTSRDLDRAAVSGALPNQGTAASRLRVQS